MRRLLLALVTVVLGLAGAELAGAQTWPRDVTGTPAAECAALDASGTPQLCGPSNPLPVSGSGPLTGASSGAQSAGLNWFLSNPPDFNPFNVGASPLAVPFVSFLDDINLVAFQANNNAVNQYRSANGGQSWTLTGTSTSIFGAFFLEGTARLPSGTFVFMSGEISPNSPFWLSNDGFQFTRQTASGLTGQPNHSLHLGSDGVTLLSAASGAGAANDTVCRSTTSGTSWACATIGAITGYQGTGFFQVLGSSGGGQSFGTQAFESPATNTWLVVGRDTTTTEPFILRNTNNGASASWVQVFRDTGIAQNTALAGGIKCLTSQLCLAVAGTGQRIYRSTDGGATWSIIVTSGPSGANTDWIGVAGFNSTTAVIIPFGAGGTGASEPNFYRTVDGGLTFTSTGAVATCARNTGVAQGLGSIDVRSGRAVVISRYLAVTAGGPCAHYSSLGTGSTAVAGPLGVPWGIDARGFGPVYQPDTLTPFTVAPAQGLNLFNSNTTGAANTAVTVTITAAPTQRAHVYRIEASCSVGTSTVTVTDGGTNIWATLAAEVGAARYRQQFTPAITSSTNSALVVTLATCGVGNAGTLIVHADQY